jgi:transcriptional regulator with XRE-family HTH domain
MAELSGVPEENTATQAEVAAYLRISVRTLRRWEAGDTGPPRLLTRRRIIRYDWPAVREWAAGDGAQLHGVTPRERT